MKIEEMKTKIEDCCKEYHYCEGCPLEDKYIPFCYIGEDEDVIKSNYETIFVKPPFTLSDIKGGYLVKIRRGDVLIVIPKPKKLWRMFDKEECPISSKEKYREDMTDIDDSKEYDIMEVYGESSGGIFNTSRRELLFKREEEPSTRDIKIKELQDKMDAIKREMDDLK